MIHEMKREFRYRDLLPLFIIVGIIVLWTAALRLHNGWDFNEAMLDFMAGFFLVFGTFKIINLTKFAQAYQIYDVIAQRSTVYAYSYPFIEVGLGMAYLLRCQLFLANCITLIIMAIGSISVIIEFSKKRQVTCACLGMVFKLPMTYVTLAEDLIMGLMALYMLLL